MTFLHPLLVWGMLLGAIPIIIHILSRRRYKVIRWAATDFLLDALAERSRSVRIQDLILLLLRIVVLVLAAVAVARPILTADTARWASVAAGGTDAVIVIDTSYSMHTNVAGQTRMSMARQKAHAVLASLPEKARVGIVYMDESATRATDGLIPDRTRIGAAIDAAGASASGTDAAPALAAALEMLESSTASTKRVFVVTDAQARAFDRSAGAVRQSLTEADSSIGFVVLVVPNTPAANLAVTDLEVKSRWLRVGAPIQFDARLRDLGDPPAAEAQAELWIDGRKVDRQRVPLLDGAATATFRYTFTAAGLLPIEVRLDPDAVEVDNHRYAAISIPSAIEVAVVTGESSDDSIESAYVYIETALQSSSDNDADLAPPFNVRPLVARDRLADELAEAGPTVLVLADPGGLPVDAVEALTKWAAHGGSVLILVGPDAVATLGPMRTGERGAASWLADVAFTPPETAEPSPDDVVQLDPTQAPAGAAVIDLESPGMRETLAAVNVFRALAVDPADGSGWSVFLRYTDARPALLTRELAAGADADQNGMGRLALFTSSLDASWCDLPYRPAIVPILNDTLLWLVAPRLVAAELAPGQAWSPVVAGELDGLKILMPDDTMLEVAGFIEPIPSARGARLRFDRTDNPGVYRLAGAGPAVQQRDCLQATAVNVDTRESDQAVWSTDQILSLFPKDRCEVLPADISAGAVPLAELSGSEAWPMAVLLLLVLLLIETLLAYRFSLSKKSAGPVVTATQPSTTGGTP